MKLISTERAAKPLGHYSQATVHNGTVYVATQLGIVPGKPIVVGTIAEQTRDALNNVREILKAAGSDLHKVLRVTVYVAEIRFWDEVNAVYTEYFGEHKPARGIVPCGVFHKGFQVAFDVIAAV
jgi:2-iminobutanoate/2-iminopropanoate deaminase